MIGGSFDIPVMHQDLANSTMPPLNLPFGAYVNPYSNTSYHGGVQMKPQLDHDKLLIKKQKENEDMSTFKKVLIALSAIVALGCVPLVRKGIKKSGGFVPYLKNLWKGNNTSYMSKITNWFSSVGKSMKKGAYNVTVKPAKAIGRGFKKLGSGIKNIFKKNS